MDLYEKKNYITHIPFIHSVLIREYDIEKANINVLYKYGAINNYTYEYLLKAPRDVRQYTIGNLQKDKKITKILQQGIIESKKLFFEANNISDSDIISIKNDAIFILNKTCNITCFDNINFTLRNIYNLFTKIGPNKTTEVYYGYDSMSGDEVIDIKGINDNTLEKYHSQYFISLLCEIFYNIESNPSSEVLPIIYQMYMNYINKSYPVEFYREFNSDSLYSLINNRLQGLPIRKINYINEQNKGLLDISYNSNIIREIYSYLSTIYFRYN